MSDQQPDPRPGAYYVSVIDGPRRALLAGPWDTHAEALAAVDTVRELGQRIDPKSHFYAWGTARLPDDDSVPIREGSLNRRLHYQTGHGTLCSLDNAANVPASSGWGAVFCPHCRELRKL